MWNEKSRQATAARLGTRRVIALLFVYTCPVLAAERKAVAGSENSEASHYLPQHTDCVCIKGLYLCLG